jgi:hypothetical protein
MKELTEVKAAADKDAVGTAKKSPRLKKGLAD